VRVSTEAALAARRKATEAALKRVHDAITGLRREKTQVSVAAIARRAGVSRSFTYDNPGARAAVSAALAEVSERRVQLLAAQDDELEATWRERALNAEDGLKAAHAEIITQRARIGELLGQVRDLESEWTKEAIARITTENTTLKQRVRQLTADNRTLEERLQAARSNRFADRRIAQLEAELASPPGTQGATLCPPSPWTPEMPCCSSSAAGWNRTTITSPRPWPCSPAARTAAPPHPGRALTGHPLPRPRCLNPRQPAGWLRGTSPARAAIWPAITAGSAREPWQLVITIPRETPS
jgi:hypothetical protein